MQQLMYFIVDDLEVTEDESMETTTTANETPGVRSVIFYVTFHKLSINICILPNNLGFYLLQKSNEDQKDESDSNFDSGCRLHCLIELEEGDSALCNNTEIDEPELSLGDSSINFGADSISGCKQLAALILYILNHYLKFNIAILYN